MNWNLCVVKHYRVFSPTMLSDETAASAVCIDERNENEKMKGSLWELTVCRDRKKQASTAKNIIKI